MTNQHKDLHVVVHEYGLKTIHMSGAYEIEDNVWFNLEDQICIGPICDLETFEGINNRKAWFEKKFEGLINSDKIFNAIDNDNTTLSAIQETAMSCRDIYIWTGFSGQERISTARILNQMQNLDNRIFLLDLSCFQFINRIGEMISPNSLVVISSDQIEEVSKHFKQINSTELLNWKSLWGEVQSGNSGMRVLGKDGSISKQPFTYFDSFLLSNCSEDFKKAANVIGNTLIDIDFAVGDEFLNWRLKELSKNEKLEYWGTLKDIRDYEVRKAV